ncbi:DNA/RNA helicase domain-containing protein [Methanocalculus natronophilus]|uniref:DNA/RNA helicase domain-containing protein n=2 Tax=Methanocalculus TaxID=71151 RepID=UPI0031B637C4
MCTLIPPFTPGSGKTLVGLRFAYETSIDGDTSKNHAVFLSGNGPLVKVLQHALNDKIFVQDVHGFLRQYGGSMTKTPSEHMWIYDEAQRAWDKDHVQEKRGAPISEPEDFLSIGERMDSWTFMIALIGEGQEIHLGEEAGIIQWNEAIAKMKESWTIHCPEKIKPVFSSAGSIKTNTFLDLSASLRSHIAEDVTTWIHSLLRGDLDTSHHLADKMYLQGFDGYVTRDINDAVSYVRARYRSELDKRFGFLASSKAKNLPKHGIHNEYNYTQNLRVGPWYNDPSTSKYSCCALRDVATEFACQGLELDFPIVCWGDDLRWNGGSWRSPQTTSRAKAKDPHKLRLNSYRVLLSRGRDGFIVFVPDEANMTSTYNALIQAGLRVLPVQST